MRTMENKSKEVSLCEWCGKPLTGSVIMKVSDDSICPACYWAYRKDQYQVKNLQRGIQNG